MSARASLRAAIGCGVLAVLAGAAVGGAGESAATPGLGPGTAHPPWDAALGPDPVLVSGVLVVADVLGAAALVLALLALRRGARPSPRFVALAGTAAVLLLVLVPPVGSADHLSYTAYGRIAAAGDDPYLQDPLDWRGGTDPVASAIQPPWRHTPSVYGPVGTLAQAAAAVAGGGELRLTVWAWQLLCAGAFLTVGFVLDRLTRHDPAARARAALLWTLNPLLLRQLVLGAHIDVLAVAAGIGALALAARRPVLAGALVGVAAGVELPYALFGLAVCWALGRAVRRGELSRPQAWRHLTAGLLGAAAVLVPVHLWSGPHTYDQLLRASRMISFGTPWRLVADLLDPVFGRVPVREVVGPVAIVCALLLMTLMARRVFPRAAPAGAGATAGAWSGAAALPAGPRDRLTADATRAAAVLAVGWVLTAPYALPWYDPIAWAPLALLGASALDAAMLARLAVLSLAYVPGRVIGLTPELERFTLGFRREVAPWLTLAVLLFVIRWAVRRGESLRVATSVPDPVRKSPHTEKPPSQ